MRKLILRNHQSPGDIVVLTAAVRDLKRLMGEEVQIDVRTTGMAFWEYNPYLTPLREGDPGVEVIDCESPLIHQSNTGPWHFIHAYQHDLSAKLGVRLVPGEFRGDIHLAAKEVGWMSQVQEITGERVPFWIVVAGGKYDFTAKWWAHERWQEVVDHFAGKILFVQVGEKGHHHPALRGVIDLRGKTDLRQLVRLMYHAEGVMCGVTMAMHLAAAVPVPPGRAKNRACVVVAGGREPMQWEAYPHHQYIHTNGALRCCDQGGCWKSRTVRLGDGDKKDASLCVDVVELATGRRRPGGDWEEESSPVTERGGAITRYLPRCLEMIDAEEVSHRIGVYFRGGATEFLAA